MTIETSVREHDRLRVGRGEDRVEHPDRKDREPATDREQPAGEWEWSGHDRQSKD
jgi:hypothetical protein